MNSTNLDVRLSSVVRWVAVCELQAENNSVSMPWQDESCCQLVTSGGVYSDEYGGYTWSMDAFTGQNPDAFTGQNLYAFTGQNLEAFTGQNLDAFKGQNPDAF